MTDLSELLRPLVDHVGPGPTLDQLASRARSRRRRRRAAVAACAAAVGVITGLSFSAAQSGNSPRQIVTVGPSAALSVPRSQTTSTLAAPPLAAAGQAALRLVLDRTVAPANGVPIQATVVVNNRGKPIWIGCGDWIQIGLTNNRAPFVPIWPANLCAPATLSPARYIPTGVSRYQITIDTTYQSCSQSTTPSPALKCLGPNRTVMPILPPGVYQTRIYLSPANLMALPPPKNVTLTPVD